MRILARLLAFLRRRGLDRDLDDELAFHLEMSAARHRREGLREGDAETAARKEFGSVAKLKEDARDAWTFTWLETALWDARLALRSLSRDRTFTLLALIMLTVGMAANIVAFSITDAVLLRPLPYQDPGQLAVLGYTTSAPSGIDTAVPTTSIEAWTRSGAFESAATFTTSDVIVSPSGDRHLELLGAYVSETFLSVLGGRARIAEGRGFVSEDFQAGASRVTILNNTTWRDRFGGDPTLVGKELTIGGRSYSVVGVLAPEFRFPSHRDPAVVMPIPPTPQGVVRFVGAIARLPEDVTDTDVQAQLRQVELAARDSYPRGVLSALSADSVPVIVPLSRHLAGVSGEVAPIAFGGAGFVLLLACMNVAALLMARTARRSAEFRMRVALGATRRRIVQTVAIEVILLALIGAVAATLVSAGVLAPVGRILASYGSFPALRIDVRVLGLVTGLMVFAAGVCALLPMGSCLVRANVVAARQPSPGTLYTRVERHMERALVAGQVAIALSLLAGATLLLNTFWRLSNTPLGFAPAQVLTARVSFIGGGYTAIQRQALTSDLLERLAGTPGVGAAGAATTLPLGGQMFGFVIPIEGQATPARGGSITPVDLVTPGYFRTMGTPILLGRDFEWSDGASAPAVALVNEAFVRERLNGQNPVGRRLALGGGPADANIAIVGVVRDLANRGPREPIEAHVYRPFAQAAPQMTAGSMWIAVKTTTNRAFLPDVIRQLVAGIAPQAAVYDIATMPERLAEIVIPERHRAVVFGTLAGVAVLLAAVGMYSLLTAFVVQARREFGLRLALGSTGSQLQFLVLRQLAGPLFIGALIGLLGALTLSRSLSVFLYGVNSTDPATFAIAVGGLAFVAASAALVPARRAARTTPMLLLRAE